MCKTIGEKEGSSKLHHLNLVSLSLLFLRVLDSMSVKWEQCTFVTVLW